MNRHNKIKIGLTAAVFFAVGGAFLFSGFLFLQPDQKLAAEINAKVAQEKSEITAYDIDPGTEWKRVCIFGPYSTDESAAKILGFNSGSLARSQVPFSDSVAALVYLGEDDGILEVVDVNRSPVDLAPLSDKCFTPKDFPLRIP